MSKTAFDSVVHDIQKTLSGWGPDAPLEKIRSEFEDLVRPVGREVPASVETVNAGGVPAAWVSAPEARKDRVILYLHGGGYMIGSLDSHRDICERLSRAARARVLQIDYRLAPEHPFPAALEDAVAAYRWLLEQGVSPNCVAISGDSAGGGLTLATLLSLRESKDRLPACAALMSPWVDLECNSGTMSSKASEDPLVTAALASGMASAYANGGSLRNPLVSPVHADLAGLPPLMIHIGSSETLLDDSLGIAAHTGAADVDLELKIWRGMIHVFQLFASRLDEGAASLDELGKFIDARMTAAVNR